LADGVPVIVEKYKIFQENILMIKRSYSLISPVTLGLLAGMGLSAVQLNAQKQSDPQPPSPSSQQQAAPDGQSQSQQAHVQTFAGTIT
jgi:hypothetical protein